MSDQYLGEIRVFSGNYAPEDWAMCNGQLLPISQYQALYTLIGTTYGGDGQSTFALPDLRGRLGIHMGTNQTISYPLGGYGGTETVTLLETQLPTHTHTLNAQQTQGTSTSPKDAFWASSPLSQYSTKAADSQMAPQSVSYEGGNQWHDNMMPFSTQTFIIALQGIFPTRS